MGLAMRILVGYGIAVSCTILATLIYLWDEIFGDE